MLSFPAVLPSSSSAAVASIDDKSSANLNIHGESPPPKEIPDMSSATFVSVETSFASNQPVTRSLSSVTSNNKSSKLPLPTSNGTSNGHSVSNQNRINNAKKSDLERISPWLVS